jgi:starch phosphorylase
MNHGHNGFVIPKADYGNMSVFDQDNYDLNQLYQILTEEILPMYYENYGSWRQIMKNAMDDVRFRFESNRMAHEYYAELYNG